MGKISRRKFIVRSLAGGTGVLLGVVYFTRNGIRRSIFEYLNNIDEVYLGNTDTPQLWFEILSDNSVILKCPKVEMGQGIFTGLTQIAAEELGVDMTQIRTVHAETFSGNIDGLSTGGSTSISGLWEPLRQLAATLREMLKNEAAKKMELDADQLQVSNGVVSGAGKSMTFGEIVNGVTQWEILKTPPLKSKEHFTVVGKPIPRIDLVDKVMGKPIFGMDAQMPEMLFGSIARPSRIGAKFKSANASEAEKMPGVIKVVIEKDFAGVVAESQVEAENAKEKIKVDWEIRKNWQTRDIEEMIKVGKGEPIVIQKQGNPKKALEGSDLITSEYNSPIGAHAQLEPNGAVAYVDADQATVIISTQVVKITRNEVAERLGLAKEKVNIIPAFLGGGFGRRLHTPNAVQAALLSKAVGKPVKCFFNRKEEFQNDTFRPPTHHVLRAKLNNSGLIEAIEHNVSSGDVFFGSPIFPSISEPILGADAGAWRGAMIQYRKIPNYRAISWRVKLPFATSWWRSLGLLANTFAIESFIDELTIRSGKDPVQFRLDQIQDDKAGERLKKVIQTAAEKSGYRNEAVEGKAMGIAASTDGATPVAHVAEVSVANNKIKVHKVTCVIDCGIAVNPDQVKAQCEGSIIMGISASMFEKMYVEDGELLPTIYGPYEMALMRDAPKEIDVVILENDEQPRSVGEPPLGPIAAAIANAVFRLTGQRLRELPLRLS